MIPISVRVKNAAVDQHVTNLLSSISWRNVAPGGFASAQLDFNSPIDRSDPRLAAFTRVYIYNYDGTVLFEGRLQMPGRSASDRGEVWSVAALGPSAHASDRRAVLVYIDADKSRWVKAPNNAAGAEVGLNSDPLGTELEGLRCQFPGGQAITTNSRAQVGYEQITQSAMEIGAYGFSWNAGITDTNYTVQSVTGTIASRFNEAPSSQATNGSVPTVVSRWCVDDFNAPRYHLTFRMIRAAGGATTIANDNTWAQTWNIRVLGRRMLKTGALVSGSAGMVSTIRVRSHQVVEDLLGRLLPQFDGTNARVDTTTTDIDQLSYPDGVSPAEVLEDLMKFDPAYYWTAGPSNEAGLYSFEYKPWPTAARYEATVADGFDSPAPSFEQYNRVNVRWRDSRGQIKSTIRTQTIAELDEATPPVVREYLLDLGDDSGSAANAIIAGDQFLAEHRYPPSGGSLTVARKIIDLVDGRSIDPWQIQPGELIRVRGVEASMDVLEAAHRDGLTIFRIVSVEASDSGSVQLELDMFTPTEIHALVDLQKQRRQRR